MKAVKITVDIFMLVFMILSVIRWDGDPAFHVAAGCGCAFFFIVHLFLNRKWLAAVTKKLKTGRASTKIKLQYIIDVLLIIVWSFTIITGLIAFSLYNETEAGAGIGRLHGIPARLGCGLVLVHILQHLKQICSYFRHSK